MKDNEKLAREMKAIELIDLIEPTHGRTGCDDKYMQNVNRCLRCTFLSIAKNKKLPDYTLQVDVVLWKAHNEKQLEAMG